MELIQNHTYATTSGNSTQLPNIQQQISNLGSLSQSSPEFSKLKSYIIDNPQDEELPHRQKLWNFQQQNRGALVKIKTNNQEKGTKDASPTNCLTDVPSQETEKENHKQKHFPKLKTRQKIESRGSGASAGANECAPAIMNIVNQKESNLVYSSDLQIGNTLYSQIRGKDRVNIETTFSNNDDTKRSVVHSIDRLPSLSTSFTKLGYLKMTKNVVHYGGGFFGRHADKRYTDLRRSLTTIPSIDVKAAKLQHIDPLDSKETKKPHSAAEIGIGNVEKTKGNTPNGKMKLELSEPLSLNIRSMKQQSHRNRHDNEKKSESPKQQDDADVTPKPKQVDVKREVESLPVSVFEIQGIKQIEKVDNETNQEKHLQNLKKYRLLPPAPVVTRRYLEDKKDKTLKRVKLEDINWSENKVDKQTQDMKKAKQKVSEWLQPETGKRPASEISLDIPNGQFGPTSQPKEKKQGLNYGLNPYRWNSKPNLSIDDKDWVERTINKNTVIDNSTYDTFARTKPANLAKSSREETTFTDTGKSKDR